MPEKIFDTQVSMFGPSGKKIEMPDSDVDVFDMLPMRLEVDAYEVVVTPGDNPNHVSARRLLPGGRQTERFLTSKDFLIEESKLLDDAKEIRDEFLDSAKDILESLSGMIKRSEVFENDMDRVLSSLESIKKKLEDNPDLLAEIKVNYKSQGVEKKQSTCPKLS